MRSRFSLQVVILLFGSLLLFACSGGKPYRLMVEAAKSPERPAVFVHDKRLRIKLREALLLAVPESTLSVSPYVSGGRAFLVGWVKDEAQKMTLEDAARGVSGLLSVSEYLPVKPTGAEAPDMSDELQLKTKVVGALLAASRS